MYEPPGPAHHVKHKKTKEGGVQDGSRPADPAYYFSWCIHYLRHLDANSRPYSARRVSMAYQDTHPQHYGCSRWLETRPGFHIENIERAAWPESPLENEKKNPRMGPLTAAAPPAAAAGGGGGRRSREHPSTAGIAAPPAPPCRACPGMPRSGTSSLRLLRQLQRQPAQSNGSSAATAAVPSAAQAAARSAEQAQPVLQRHSQCCKGTPCFTSAHPMLRAYNVRCSLCCSGTARVAAAQPVLQRQSQCSSYMGSVIARG